MTEKREKTETGPHTTLLGRSIRQGRTAELASSPESKMLKLAVGAGFLERSLGTRVASPDDDDDGFRAAYIECEQQLQDTWLQKVLLDFSEMKHHTPPLRELRLEHKDLMQDASPATTRCATDSLSEWELREVERALESGDDVSILSAANLVLGDTGPSALTVKQPWARALWWEVKDVENRG